MILTKEDNVKKLYRLLDTETKKQVLDTLFDLYGKKTKRESIRINWLVKGVVPNNYSEEVIDKVIEVLQKAHSK